MQWINSIRITYLLFGLAVLSVVFHNNFYGSFEIGEPVFFIITSVFTLGFVISAIHNTYSYMRKGKPEDLYKLGWIGLFGLAGLIPEFNFGFFGFLGFFGFFGSKKGWKRSDEKN